MFSFRTGLSPGLLAAIVLHAGIAPAVLLTAPAVAAQYGAQLGLTPDRIGLMISVEMAMMSLATLPAWYWQTRLDWRAVAAAAVLLFCAANIASVFAQGFGPVLALRGISGLGGGTLMLLGLSSAVLSQQRDRVYAGWVCGQLVLGAIGLWVLPGLFAQYGLAALFGGLALLMGLTLPLTRCYPPRILPQSAASIADAPHAGRVRVALGIAGLLLFYIGLSGVWTFVGGISAASSVMAETNGRILSFATMLGIAGSLSASAIGNSLPRRLMLTLGFAGMAGAILAFADTPGLIRFAMAACVFKFVWTFVLPFILGALSELDSDGRVMGTANLVIGTGLAIGPAVAGQIITRQQGSFDAMLLTAAALTILSYLAVMVAQRARTVAPLSKVART